MMIADLADDLESLDDDYSSTVVADNTRREVSAEEKKRYERKSTRCVISTLPVDLLGHVFDFLRGGDTIAHLRATSLFLCDLVETPQTCARLLPSNLSGPVSRAASYVAFAPLTGDPSFEQGESYLPRSASAPASLPVVAVKAGCGGSASAHAAGDVYLTFRLRQVEVRTRERWIELSEGYSWCEGLLHKLLWAKLEAIDADVSEGASLNRIARMLERHDSALLRASLLMTAAGVAESLARHILRPSREADSSLGLVARAAWGGRVFLAWAAGAEAWFESLDDRFKAEHEADRARRRRPSPLLREALIVVFRHSFLLRPSLLRGLAAALAVDDGGAIMNAAGSFTDEELGASDVVLKFVLKAATAATNAADAAKPLRTSAAAASSATAPSDVASASYVPSGPPTCGSEDETALLAVLRVIDAAPGEASAHSAHSTEAHGAKGALRRLLLVPLLVRAKGRREPAGIDAGEGTEGEGDSENDSGSGSGEEGEGGEGGLMRGFKISTKQAKRRLSYVQRHRHR